METSADGTFEAREIVAAGRFADAAYAAGVQRVVYLGGLVPADAPPSRHLSSRLEVERLLLEASPAGTALRASIVIGAESRSFRFLVRLVERLRIVPLPAWREHRTQPIDIRDAVEFLARCDRVRGGGRALAGHRGPDVLTYGEMIQRIAELMLVGRATLPISLTVTPVAARVAAAIAGEDPELIGPLMEGLGTDLLPARHGGRAAARRAPALASPPPWSARCATGRPTEPLASALGASVSSPWATSPPPSTSTRRPSRCGRSPWTRTASRSG